MNVILLSRRSASARQLNLAHPLTLSIVASLALAVLGSAFALGLTFGRGAAPGGVISVESQRVGAILAEQKRQIADLRQQLQLRVDAMAMRLGEVNAHVIRLDALGKRLTEMADIDSREFNFDRDPPSGGPEGEEEGVSAQIPDLTAMLNRLEQRVDQRDSQLAALENVILARELKQQIHPEGRPVTSGFISSYFGERSDPFDGREAFHKGVDFAGSAGQPVVAVAAGVVTWAGERSGYGRLVEINHGDGYVTRYGHNERTLVNVGQTVKRGESVALMGSTGRSTGPHVHFEVLRNGRQVNPLSFVAAAEARR
jgi:murein DD-endopeptidase MepM/ murein hydrolase activator NlpD